MTTLRLPAMFMLLLIMRLLAVVHAQSMDDQPTEDKPVETFLGYFETQQLYTMFCYGVPAAFLLFKIGLFIYFAVTYGSLQRKDERLREGPDKA